MNEFLNESENESPRLVVLIDPQNILLDHRFQKSRVYRMSMSPLLAKYASEFESPSFDVPQFIENYGLLIFNGNLNRKMVRLSLK